MLKKIIFICIFIFLSFSLSPAGEKVDLERLTSECVQAAKRYKDIQNDVAYKVLHQVQYEGWSGNIHTFALTYPVKMTIRYAGASKKGYYWFSDTPEKKYHISAQSDFSGNFMLEEKVENGLKNYTFRGLMKDGVIKGVWEKDGKQTFAFYVKAMKGKSE